MAGRNHGRWVSEDNEGILLHIRAQPGASSPAVGPVDPWRGALRVSVRAKAEGGEANEELRRALAAALGVPPSAVSVESGATSRFKTVRVAGVRAADARRALGARP